MVGRFTWPLGSLGLQEVTVRLISDEMVRVSWVSRLWALADLVVVRRWEKGERLRKGERVRRHRMPPPH